MMHAWPTAGADSGGGRTWRPPPLKLEKIWFVCVKSWFFTRNTPKSFAPTSAIGKNMIFLRKIVIFHTKYPNNFRASLRNWKKYDFWGVKSWFFFTRNTLKMFAPPSARRNFFKCAPPNLKSWIRPWTLCNKVCLWYSLGTSFLHQ